MLINEGADAVQQGVCTPEGADLAMKLGVNHPAGPFEFLARWDAVAVATLLGHLDAHYRGERYRVGPWLRERAWLALLDARGARKTVSRRPGQPMRATASSTRIGGLSRADNPCSRRTVDWRAQENS